jgi:hypothetical protein
MFERPGFLKNKCIQSFAAELKPCKPEEFSDRFRTRLAGAQLLQRSIAERGTVGQEAQCSGCRPPQIYGVQGLIDRANVTGRDESPVTGRSGNWIRETNNASQALALQSPKALANEPAFAVPRNLV